MAVLMYHNDKGHDALFYYAILKGLTELQHVNSVSYKNMLVLSMSAVTTPSLLCAPVGHAL